MVCIGGENDANARRKLAVVLMFRLFLVYRATCYVNTVFSYVQANASD